MIRAVLFDMDGVLVDSYEAWFHLANAGARDLGYPPISRENFHQSWGQGVEADVEKWYVRHTVAEVEAYYNSHFTDHLAHITTHPQARRVLAELRNAGTGTAVITNTPAPIAREVLRGAGLEADALVGGTDVPLGKPAPDMVLRALDLLGADREEAIVVGDSRYDLEAAAAAGVRFAGFGIEGDETLGELADILRLTSSSPRG